MQTKHQYQGDDIQKNWFLKWWPCFVIIGLLVWSIIDQIFLEQLDTTPIVGPLINGIGVLAIVIYVIYTKDLAESSQKTAEANVRIVESMQSRILEEWECRKCSNVILIRGGEDVSRVLHISDKEINEQEYTRFTRREKLNVLVFKPMNMGPRPVLLKRVKFIISDTRCKRERDLSWDPGKPVVIQKDKNIEIIVCYDMEGMISARVAEIEYQDGVVNQTLWIANPFTERRHEPEPEAERPV